MLSTGTRFSTTRVTEGFAGAFEPRQPFTDSGTRIVVRYDGVPSNARLFVPDFIAGSSAVQVTSAGDLGWPASGGAYTVKPGGSLLLARIMGTDLNGNGGRMVFPPVPPETPARWYSIAPAK